MTTLPIAAPSCVIRDHIIANANFLASKVEEVGLCFFQAKACLKYSKNELPLELATLPLRWHIHLPADLNWANATHAAKMAHKVASKAAFLKPRFAVLHPPTTTDLQKVDTIKSSEDMPAIQSQLLYDFAKQWYNCTQLPILLENIDGAPLADLDANLFNSLKAPFGICLDVGHMLGFGQEKLLLESGLLKYVRLVHWSAPGKRDEHLALTHYSTNEYKVVKQLVPRLPHTACHMFDLFNWDDIIKSYPILKKLLDSQP